MSRCECIQCGYELTPLVRSVRVAATCPECGHVGLPAPVGFMGKLTSRPRTLFYMVLPMLVAGALVVLLKMVRFPLYGLPILLALPVALFLPTWVASSRETRGRGRPMWAETMWLMFLAWAASAAIAWVCLWFARVL